MASDRAEWVISVTRTNLFIDMGCDLWWEPLSDAHKKGRAVAMAMAH